MRTAWVSTAILSLTRRPSHFALCSVKLGRHSEHVAWEQGYSVTWPWHLKELPERTLAYHLARMIFVRRRHNRDLGLLDDVIVPFFFVVSALRIY